MTVTKTALAALALAGLLLAGCGGSDTGDGPQDASGPDARAATAAAEGPEAGTCVRVGGDWNANAGQCVISAAMCAATAGIWIEGTGCTVEATDEVGCRALAGNGGLDGFKGIEWRQGRCVLAYLASDELAQQGF